MVGDLVRRVPCVLEISRPVAARRYPLAVSRHCRVTALTMALFLFGNAMSGPIGLVRAEEMDTEAVAGLLELVLDADPDSARSCLVILRQKLQTGELPDDQAKPLKRQLTSLLAPVLKSGATHPVFVEAALLAASWHDAAALGQVKRLVADGRQSHETRLAALATLVHVQDPDVWHAAKPLIVGPDLPPETRATALGSLGRYEDARLAEMLLAAYPQLDPALQPKVVELLLQRPAWSKTLLAAIRRGTPPPSALHVNQVARLQASRDPELARMVRETWGTVRTERQPQREQVIREVRELLTSTPGDAPRGKVVFHKLCGQCHKIFGEGQEVGPDLTVNGRGSLDQLLSNVLDPSLVIGAAYQARTVATADGRVLTGLAVEDNEQRVVLKTQGGKLETIARDDVDEIQVSSLSLMPEGIEKQLSPQELADLFAFLILEKGP